MISSVDGANFLIVSVLELPTPPLTIISSNEDVDEIDEIEEVEFMRELEDSVSRRAFLRTLLRRRMVA